MKLLTDVQANQLILEFDEAEVEKEFRKGRTFYAYCTLVVTQAIVEYAQEEFEVDISGRLGWAINGSGMWSDDDGLDLYSFCWAKPVLVHVPESVVVTPAHTLTTYESTDD